MKIEDYWKAALHQDAAAMKEFFVAEAIVRWHNSNEAFCVDEFIQVNCEYPNEWDGEIERVERINDLLVCVVHVFANNQPLSFHVTSFIQTKADKIIAIDEYWGNDGPPPQWRANKKIGTVIHA